MWLHLATPLVSWKKHYTACESMSLEEHALKAAQEAAESQAAAADDPRSHVWYWYLSLFTKCFNGAELGNSPPQQSVLWREHHFEHCSFGNMFVQNTYASQTYSVCSTLKHGSWDKELVIHVWSSSIILLIYPWAIHFSDIDTRRMGMSWPLWRVHLGV